MEKKMTKEKNGCGKCRLMLALLLALVALPVAAQTQRGRVRTAQRPNREAVGIADVSIRVKGGQNIVLSNAEGWFELPMQGIKSGETFSFSSIRKSGYELIDNGIIGRQFTYSATVPVEIVMVNTLEKEADRQRIANKAYAHAEASYIAKVAELERQLRESKISQEAYRSQLQALQEQFDKFEALISNMAERYATADYATLDSLNAAINLAIEEGNYERADSLTDIRTTSICK